MEHAEVSVKDITVEVATFSNGTIIKRQRPETANNSNPSILPLFNRPMDGQTFIRVFKKGVTISQIVQILEDPDFNWTSDGEVVHPAPRGAATFESKCQHRFERPAGIVVVKNGSMIISNLDVPDGEYQSIDTANRQTGQLYKTEIRFV
jgi:hypothetical protein